MVLAARAAQRPSCASFSSSPCPSIAMPRTTVAHGQGALATPWSRRAPSNTVTALTSSGESECGARTSSQRQGTGGLPLREQLAIWFAGELRLSLLQERGRPAALSCSSWLAAAGRGGTPAARRLPRTGSTGGSGGAATRLRHVGGSRRRCGRGARRTRRLLAASPAAGSLRPHSRSSAAARTRHRVPRGLPAACGGSGRCAARRRMRHNRPVGPGQPDPHRSAAAGRRSWNPAAGSGTRGRLLSRQQRKQTSPPGVSSSPLRASVFEGSAPFGRG